MHYSGQRRSTLNSPRSAGGRRPPAALVFFLCLYLGACATQAPDRLRVSALPPLHTATGVVPLEAVDQLAPAPDLLALDQQMRDFVHRYTQGVPRGRQQLLMLHQAIRGEASLGIRYDPAAGGSAREVFYRGQANCLAYATLFIALAREAGFDARYQWVNVRPQWTLRGERVMVRLHVNALVRVPHAELYMVDIDPLPLRDIAGSRKMRDSDAQALYHSNIAMEALAQGDVELAWLQSVRALQLSPALSHLWVNLGATYRASGQHRVAESSYLQALQLDRWNYSAMNNLVVLYTLEGREEARAYWDQQVASYRDANPYYHAWLGDQAAGEDDWRRALQFYEKALQLSPDDSRLLYAVGLSHYELNQPALGSTYIERAIQHAILRSDIDAYRLQLDTLQAEYSTGT